jgi:alcohol-forming fatty acyl-CoA reductase
MIIDKCDIIINSAASVNFNDPLQEALQINYFGCQRVLELAKECKHLEIFTQVSTCYVNCNRLGYIEEKIYNPDADVGSIVQNIMNMTVQDIKASESKLIGDYPNTYTFTKMMAEKQLVQSKGDLNVVIWRPAIIASSISDPFPGWTDQLSAAGGVTILGGMGFIPYLYGTGLNTVDLIPVDIVTNGLLVATCHGARPDTEKLHIYNCGTSVQNPITLYDYKETMLKYYKYLRLNE